MTDEQILETYHRASGKAEGICEATGQANFPIIFAREILKLDRAIRDWSGLTDEDISQAMFKSKAIVTGPVQFDFAHAIEAKLREKNGG